MTPLADYFAYTRPRSIPVTLVMAMTGWLASPSRTAPVGDLAFLLVVYSGLLWGGTNAFNSAEDRDSGPVNLLPNPPPLPRHLGAFGLSLMAAAIVAAGVLRGWQCAALVTGAVVLSIFYSWRGAPWPRGKEIPGVDNLINASGCGIGSFCLGWCTTGEPLTAMALYFGLAWTVCLFGGMPTAQIFQLRPDDRGSNWTAHLGAARTLRFGAVLFMLHFALLARVSSLGIATVVWGAGVVSATLHSAWWSRDPFVQPYHRMLRQMTLLTVAQLAWAIGA